MQRRVKYYYLLAVLFCTVHSYAQTSFDGINYQIRLRDTSGALATVVFPMNAKISIHGSLTQPYYEEIHVISSWNAGLINLITGQGTPTGIALYASLRDINFVDSLKIRLEIDFDATGYQLVEDNYIKAVPFANYSIVNLHVPVTKNMGDVDTNFVSGYILKWSSGKWVCSPDLMSDTANFAMNSGASVLSDTAQFGYTSIHLNVDTANFSFFADSANYGFESNNVLNADTSYHSIYAATADTVLYAWYLKGNHSLSNFSIGTNDSTAFVFRSNNINRMRISPRGNFYLGIDTSTASFYQKSNLGFLYRRPSIGTPWTFTGVPVSSAFYFRADSAAFRIGSVDGDQWNTVNVSQNSFAFGRNNISNGIRSSIVFGDSCDIHQIPPPGLFTPDFTDGYASFAFGHKCEAHGRHGISVGYECKTYMFRNVAMGYQCITGKESANHALGYRARAFGSTAGSFGYATVASGNKSFAIGSYASTNGHKGSFVYGDASTTDTVKNTADNQFMIRAAGGILFYSDSTLTNAAQLLSGSGSWNIVSDSLKKENFDLLQTGSLPTSLNSLSVYSWNYISQDTRIRHIGPTAQNFYRHFKFGESNTKISMVDMDGVTLFYIQQEFERMMGIDKRINQQETEINAELNTIDYSDMNRRADELLKKLKHK